MKNLLFSFMAAYVLIQIAFITVFGFFHEWEKSTTNAMGGAMALVFIILGYLWHRNLLFFKKRGK